MWLNIPMSSLSRSRTIPVASMPCLSPSSPPTLTSVYTHLGRAESQQPIVILGVDKTDEAVEVLEKEWVHVLGEEIYSL